MIIIINICWGPVFSHETFTIMLTVARARLWLFWFPLYRWENWGSESVGNLPKAQTLGSVKGRSCCILHSLQHSLAWGSESGQAVSGQRQSLLLMHAEQGAIAGSRVVRGPMNIAAWEEDPLREGGMDGWDREEIWLEWQQQSPEQEHLSQKEPLLIGNAVQDEEISFSQVIKGSISSDKSRWWHAPLIWCEEKGAVPLCSSSPKPATPI